jgi:hypothetical protein
MFESLVGALKKTYAGALLVEALSPADVEKLRTQIAHPDVGPCDFDVTFDGWIARISLWGKVKFMHDDPEFKSKKEISRDTFLKKVSDSSMYKTMGKFTIDRLDVNKVALYRDYLGLDGKKYRESFMVTVDLKPELKKAIR